DVRLFFPGDERAINTSSRAANIRPIGLVSRADKSTDHDTWTLHVGPISVFGGQADYDIDYKTLDEERGQGFSNVGGWLGFPDHFWLTALAPTGQPAMTADFRRSGNGSYQADYALAPAVVAPAQTLSTQTHLFAGAKEKTWLDRYEAAALP